jgi:hypothetical protein
MGASRKYWQWARDCARWATETDEPDHRELYQRMSEAWTRVAMADEDVSRQADQELTRRIH